jgi:hypothetical protein
MVNGHPTACAECSGRDLELGSEGPEYTTVASRSRGPYPPRVTGFSGRWLRCRRCGTERWQRTLG